MEAHRVSKRFDATVALDNVTIAFRPGEIHAVLGENGAGKSTLVSMLNGQLQPDRGEIRVEGAAVNLRSAADAQRYGISLVHQHFTLVPAFTVLENLALPFACRSNFILNERELASDAIEIAERLDWKLELDKRVASLSVGEQQRIEILKALASGSHAIMFDEPTSTLTREEIAELLKILRDLRESGRTVVLITHKLSEVMEVSDRVTVLRKGKVVVSDIETQNTTTEELAVWMVGESPPVPRHDRVAPNSRAKLSVSKLVVKDDARTVVDEVSFEVSGGEILGIGGLDGNGQVELAETIAGVRVPTSGRIRWTDSEMRVGYIPQDRQRDGLAPHMTIKENLLIEGHHDRSLCFGELLIPHRVRNWVHQLIEDYEIKARDEDAPAASLSGGNRQKIVVARVLSQNPNVIVAVGPTRGLDIRATQYVHDKLREARDRGAAVILFSTDFDELLDIADRVMFMSNGRLLEGGEIGKMMGGIV